MKSLTNLVLISSIFWSQSSFATFIFSNISYTSNSFTFTINGDMTGYGSGLDNTSEFNIQYFGDLWAGATLPSSNNWSSSVFDNKNLIDNGQTGNFPPDSENYSWSIYDADLSDAVATNRTVTLSMGGNYLDESALSGSVIFIWGNTVNGSSRDIGSWSFTKSASVSEPSILALISAGLFGIGFAHRSRA